MQRVSVFFLLDLQALVSVNSIHNTFINIFIKKQITDEENFDERKH